MFYDAIFVQKLSSHCCHTHTHSDTMSYLANSGAGKQRHVWCLALRRSWLRCCIIIYGAQTQHRRREICLIKRIPLKSVMECWLWVCGRWTWGEIVLHRWCLIITGTAARSQNHRREQSFNVEIQSPKVDWIHDCRRRKKAHLIICK